MNFFGKNIVKDNVKVRAKTTKRISYHSFQETGTFESYVARADQEGLSGRLLKTENIIRSDTELAGTGNVRILGPASCRQDEFFGSHGLGNSFLVDSLDCVGTLEAGVLVQIGHLWVEKVYKLNTHTSNYLMFYF